MPPAAGYGYPPASAPGYQAVSAPGYPPASAPGYQPVAGYGYPPAAGYGPYPGTSPAYASPPTLPYGPPPGARTDGLSIAALVTGVACLALLALVVGALNPVLGVPLLVLGVAPLVLGILGRRNARRNGTRGRGFAVTGIVLGSVQILVGLGLFVVLAINAANSPYGYEPYDDFSDAYDYGDSPKLDSLWDECEDGDMRSCDDLYQHSPTKSIYEDFGATCGYRSQSEDYCVDQDLDDGVQV